MLDNRSTVTVTDLFCGAGGSSHGAAGAGAEIKMALNHWQLAIDTHNSNFPNTDHHCCDVNAADPRYFPSTTILIASPECTNHSLAKGKGRARYQADLFGKALIDPSEDRSRATMWDVPRFAEVHRYELIIVENVVDARSWVLWDSWLHAMGALGYDWKIVYLNSMIAWPTPQSRDRLYAVFWRRGNRAPDLDIRPPSWCAACERQVAGAQTWKRLDRQYGRYGSRNGQYIYTCPDCRGEALPYYYPALTAIDWSLPVQRIGDRARPLQEKTLARIRLGLERFKGQLLVMETNYSHADNNRSRPVTEAWPTQTGQQSAALVAPFLGALRTNSTPRGLDEPIQTVVTDNHHFLVNPLIVMLHNNQSARPASEPLSTVTAGGTHHGVLMPFITGQYTSRDGDPGQVRAVVGPMPTISTVVGQRLAVPFISSYYRTADLSSVDDPLPTVPTHDRHALVSAPFFLSAYGDKEGYQRNPIRPVDQTAPTVTAAAVHRLAVPGETPTVDDCGFRMLEPHEIQAAMAFTPEYTVLGTKRDRIRQLGNAVTPPVMRLLAERCLATLA